MFALLPSSAENVMRLSDTDTSSPEQSARRLPTSPGCNLEAMSRKWHEDCAHDVSGPCNSEGRESGTESPQELFCTDPVVGILKACKSRGRS